MNLGSLMAILGVDTTRLNKASHDMRNFGKQGEASFGMANRGATSFLGTAMKLVGVTTALYTLQKAFRKTIEASIMQEQSLMRLETVLKSTGGVSGKTADELAKTAGAFQKITTYSDETVMELQALLLTFKDIKGDVFDQATKAAMNLSVAMKQGLKESAIQLGKALNDPILGLTAMRRVGIQFTAEQEKMIKGLVEAGDKMGAQKLILEELESQFGGMAEAMRNTLGGAIDGMKNAWGDLFEVNKHQNFDMLREKIEELTSVLGADKTKDAVLAIFGAVIEGATKAVDWVVALTEGMDKFGQMLQSVKNHLKPFNDFLEDWNKAMQEYSKIMAHFWGNGGTPESGGGGWGGDTAGPGTNYGTPEDRSKSMLGLTPIDLGYDETSWRNLRKSLVDTAKVSKVSAEAIAKYEKELAKTKMTAHQLTLVDIEEWYQKQIKEIGGTTEALEELKKQKLDYAMASPTEGLTDSLKAFARVADEMKKDTISSIRDFGVEAGVAGDTFKEALIGRAEKTADELVGRFNNPQMRNVFITALGELGRKSGNSLLVELSRSLQNTDDVLGEPLRAIEERINETVSELEQDTGKKWEAFTFVDNAEKSIVRFRDGTRDALGNFQDIIREFEKAPKDAGIGSLDASVQSMLSTAETIRSGLSGAFSEDIYMRFTEGAKTNLNALAPIGEQVGQGVGNGLYNGITQAVRRAVQEAQVELNSLKVRPAISSGQNLTDAMRGDL